MPLLVVAFITHVVYKLATKGWDWGTDTSRKAWDASFERSQRLAERIRQRLSDKLAEWDQDPRARGYAAFAVRSSGKIAKGLGKAGLWTLLKGARAAGAVTRALGGGALATTGLLGALAQATREGALLGTEWWRRKARSRSERAERVAERLWNWGRTVPGQAEETPEPEASAEEEPPVEHEQPQPQAEPEPEEPRGAYQAGEATVGEPAKPSRPATEIDNEPYVAPSRLPLEDLQREMFGEEPPGPRPAWEKPMEARPGPAEPYWAGQASTPGPTPVGSGSAGATAAAGTVLAQATQPALEGEIVSGTVATTPSNTPAAAGGTDVAPLSTPADGLAYEQSQRFLREQAARAQQLASLAEQIHQLQLELQRNARIMMGDHEQAQAALGRFRIQAPAVAEVISLLSGVAGDPAPEAAMVTAYMALEAVTNGCNSDRQNLESRFGTAWEIMRGENADGQFLNG